MRSILFILALLAFPVSAWSSSLGSVLPGAKQRGEATFRYLGFPIYDARLFTKNAAPLDWKDNFALELTYRRSVSQSNLVSSTLDELARLGGPLPVRDQLNTCFRDVKKGDRYLAVTQGSGKISFWRNSKYMCALRYPGITSRFMSIFLGNNTRSARFTRQLRGN